MNRGVEKRRKSLEGEEEECVSGGGSVEGEEEECDGRRRVPYSGKFSNNANFRTFRMKPRDTKMKFLQI